MKPVKATPHFRILRQRLKAMSEGEYWRDIAKEWQVIEIFFQPGGTCTCDYHPITEQCVIRNVVNGNQTIVGNVCVKHFLGIDMEVVFDGFKRILEDETAAMNSAAIDYAEQQSWLSTWECEFLRNTCRKRKLSERQLAKRVSINRCIVQRVHRRELQTA